MQVCKLVTVILFWAGLEPIPSEGTFNFDQLSVPDLESNVITPHGVLSVPHLESITPQDGVLSVPRGAGVILID